MRHKTIETVPFKYSYRVFNRATRKIIGEFDSLSKAVPFVWSQAHKIGIWGGVDLTFGVTVDYQRETLQEFLRRMRAKDDSSRPYYRDGGNFVVLTNVGSIVSREEIKREMARRRAGIVEDTRRDERRDMFDRRLVPQRGSGLKIKTSYAYELRPSWSGGLGYYSRVGSGYYRHPKTNHERRINIAHVDEYGWNLVRGRRRNLPSSWDDRPCGLWDLQNSWKHNSKRKKQWIPK